MRIKFLVGCLVFFSFFVCLVMAKPSINIELVGYGERVNIVYIDIYNIGDTTLRNVELWVDGVKFSTLGTLSPGSGAEKRIFLDRGKHFLEVKTSEGAYDSLNITIPSLSEMKKTKIEEEKSFFEKYRILALFLVTLVFFLSLYLLLKKPKRRI